MARGWTTGGRKEAGLQGAIEQAWQAARTRADAHFDKHAATWFSKRYDELLTAFGVTRTPAADWHTRDLQETAAECAGRHIDRKQAMRLGRITMVCENMKATGKLRVNRLPAQHLEKARGAGFAQDRRDRPAEAPPPWEGVPSRPRMRDLVLNSVDRAEDMVRARGRGGDASRLPVSVRAQREARARANAHHAKHRDAWFEKHHDAMLSIFGVTSGTTPAWAVPHLKDIARDFAERHVEDRRDSRIFLIDRACLRMRLSGKVREARGLGRDVGQGE